MLPPVRTSRGALRCPAQGGGRTAGRPLVKFDVRGSARCEVRSVLAALHCTAHCPALPYLHPDIHILAPTCIQLPLPANLVILILILIFMFIFFVPLCRRPLPLLRFQPRLRCPPSSHLPPLPLCPQGYIHVVYMAYGSELPVLSKWPPDINHPGRKAVRGSHRRGSLLDSSRIPR